MCGGIQVLWTHFWLNTVLFQSFYIKLCWISSIFHKTTNKKHLLLSQGTLLADLFDIYKHCYHFITAVSPLTSVLGFTSTRSLTLQVTGCFLVVSSYGPAVRETEPDMAGFSCIDHHPSWGSTPDPPIWLMLRFKWFKLNLFKVDCETSYPKTYIDHSRPLIPDGIHLFFERGLRGEKSQTCPYILMASKEASGTIFITSLVWRRRGSNPRPPAHGATL